MEPYDSIRSLLKVTEERTTVSDLYDIYVNQNSSAILDIIKLQTDFSRNFKYLFLLFGLIWKDINLIDYLYSIFGSEYDQSFGIKK